MNPSLFETMAVTLSVGAYTFKASGSRMVFKGYTAAYTSDEEMQDNMLPPLDEGGVCVPKEITPKQNFTQARPPDTTKRHWCVRWRKRASDARAHTHRSYRRFRIAGISRRKGVCSKPTELGMIVNNLMKNNFSDIVDVEFTADLEAKLDDIESGGKEWKKLLRDFYIPFEKTLELADKNVERVVLPVVESDIVCEKCGLKMVYKDGRFGQFLACPGYPECKNTKAIIKYIDTPCPKCGKRIVEKRSNKTRKTFYGCEGYPDCDFVSWDMPIAEKCETCGSMMALRRLSNGKSYKKCTNAQCESNQRKNKDAKGE